MNYGELYMGGASPPFTCLDRDGSEWVIAWFELGLSEINQRCDDNRECMHHDSGESWQYMGTFLEEDGMAGRTPGWWHEFRHRHHPATNKREVRLVRAIELPPKPWSRT